jgi:hypothetical protein
MKLQRLVLVVALALSTSIGACSQNGVGRPCNVGAVGAGGTAGGGEDIINSQALECPSRICLQKSAEANAVSTVQPGALCTASCTADDDCETELIDKKAPAGGKCKSKFVCAVGTDTGRFCCNKVCVCADLLPAGTPKFPETCQDRDPNNCRNLQHCKTDPAACGLSTTNFSGGGFTGADQEGDLSIISSRPE